MGKKRYEAVYIYPNFCDGFWDNEEVRYLDIDEIKDLLYKNLDDDEIEQVLNKDEKIVEEEEVKSDMSGIKLALEGIGLVLLGFVNIAWSLTKIISAIMVAGYISIKLGLNGYIWWFSSIVIFCILTKILLYGNGKNTYNELVENYSSKTKEYDEM